MPQRPQRTAATKARKSIREMAQGEVSRPKAPARKRGSQAQAKKRGSQAQAKKRGSRAQAKKRGSRTRGHLGFDLTKITQKVTDTAQKAAETAIKQSPAGMALGMINPQAQKGLLGAVGAASAAARGAQATLTKTVNERVMTAAGDNMQKMQAAKAAAN